MNGHPTELLFEGPDDILVCYREFDWASSAFGPVADWPLELRAATGIMLGASAPIAIYWGPDHHLLYNEAWRGLIADKHPHALARPAREVFPEIWEAIAPVFAQVLAGRGAVNTKHHLLRLERDGTMQDAWFDYSANPIRCSDGSVQGIFNLALETTDRQALLESEARHAFLLRLGDTLRSLADSANIEAAAARLLGQELHATRALYVEYDHDGGHGAGTGVVHRDYVRGGAESLAGTYRNDDFPTFVRLLTTHEAAVVADLQKLPGLNATEQAILERFGIRALMGASLARNGRLVAVLAAFASEPRAWTALELSLLRDTAERTWEAVERARAEAGLLDADRKKDEFLATLAHELRNPLAPLRNGLQIARLVAQSNPALLRTVDMMDRQLSHLVRLVDDLLDVARISSGKLQLQRRPELLSQVIANSVESTEVLIKNGRHELLVETEADELQVAGDFDRLSQVFTNLLSNAAKYTQPGGRICLRTSSEGLEAVVRITDSGLGIPQAELPRVFDLFSQVRAHQDQAGGGLGIGLSLVKRLVELHGGSVQAFSAGPGHGSTFTVRLPLLDAASPRKADHSWAQAANQSHWRIVVADDNIDAAESLAELLMLEGHEVRTANDGVAAVEAVRAFQPGVVFLDLGMPHMDGIEAARRIRAMPAGKDIKLVALTGWGQESDRQRTRDAGFDLHLAKPVHMTALEEVLSIPF